MFEVKVKNSFAAAHHLLNYNGECENQHGHNWIVEVTLRGENLDKSGILMDFKVLKRELRTVLDKLDHKDLNELPQFKDLSPSSETIAKYIYGELKQNLPQLCSVAVSETENSTALYYEEWE